MRPIFRSVPVTALKSSTGAPNIRRPKAVCVLEELARDLIYGPREMSDIESLFEIIAPPQNGKSIMELTEVLLQIEVLITGWGGPVLDAEFLKAAPNLKAVFFGAGAVAYIVTPAFWDRKIVLSSAYAINAIPVAEYTFATIVFSLKHAWRLARAVRENVPCRPVLDVPGCYGSTVGLVSMGMIARTLLKHLEMCDLHVLAYDPFMDQAEAEQLGIELVSLEELFTRSDVVSVHTPLFHETVGLITGSHIASMKHGATVINTSRGEIIREEELLDVLENRPDLQAVLDVCISEANPASRLLSLPNIVLTPHIAGSIGAECRRMGRFVIDEMQRYLSGQPLQGLITSKLAEKSSHRPARMRPHPEKVPVA
jgi:phosphoglycerate dehydrogenase-like enzyme